MGIRSARVRTEPTMLRKLSNNWVLKLTSLVFAFMLWFFVMGERRQEAGFSAPLNLVNIPEGLMVANEVPNLIDVRISGPRTLLMNLSPQDISISVDMKDLTPGLTSFKRLDERLNIPSALRVTRLTPSFVDVKLERILEKTVAVKVVVEGKPPQDHKLISVRSDPAVLVLSGAESELQPVGELKTEPIDLSEVRASFSRAVPVVYRGIYSTLKDQSTVEVSVEIEQPPMPEVEGPPEIQPEKMTEGGEKKE